MSTALLRPVLRPVAAPVVYPAPASADDAFSVLHLFVNGEQGAWYDPSDISTLFQDAAGTTPVTALGQPVGLMLDKSKGLVRGSEIYAGGAAAGTAGYAEKLGDTWHLRRDASGSGAVVLAAGLKSSTTYLVQLRAYSTGPEANHYYDIRGGAHGGGNTSAWAAITGPFVDVVARVRTGATSSSIETNNPNVGFSWSFDNVSVRELPGNHASQPTATARPTLQADASGRKYLQFDGVDDFLSASLVLSAYPITLAAAAKADVNAEGGVLSLYQSSTQYKCISKSPTDTQWSAYDRNASALINSEAVGTNATPHVLIARVSTDSVNLIMDSVDTIAATTNTNAFGTSSALYLGRVRETGLYLNGRVYGAGMVAKDISVAEQDVLQRFLASRSGVTL